MAAGAAALVAGHTLVVDRAALARAVVVRGHSGSALYFSRLPIPYHRKGDSGRSLLRHIGVYGFTAATLLRLPDLPSSGLDELEGLEQLRFLENGIDILVLDATGDPWGIECRTDYDEFLKRHAARSR